MSHTEFKALFSGDGHGPCKYCSNRSQPLSKPRLRDPWVLGVKPARRWCRWRSTCPKSSQSRTSSSRTWLTPCRAPQLHGFQGQTLSQKMALGVSCFFFSQSFGKKAVFSSADPRNGPHFTASPHQIRFIPRLLHGPSRSALREIEGCQIPRYRCAPFTMTLPSFRGQAHNLSKLQPDIQ